MSDRLKNTNNRQLPASTPEIDLGIVELDQRLEFSIDPLTQLVIAGVSAPVSAPLPTPGNGCVNTVAGC